MSLPEYSVPVTLNMTEEEKNMPRWQRGSTKKLEAYGIDAICEDIMGGESLLQISSKIGVSQASLVVWLSSDPERNEKSWTARSHAAIIWDELAERRVAEADNKLELAKATQLASHYRWRARVVAPKRYGDKTTTELSGPNGAPLQVDSTNLKNLTDSELVLLEQLMTKASRSKGDRND